MKKTEENPFFAMFISPSNTIKNVVENKPFKWFLFLSSIWFLQLYFQFISFFSIVFPIHILWTLLIAIIISPFLGALAFYIFGFFLYISSKILKISFSYKNAIITFAYSRLIFIINLIMWVILFFAFEELKIVKLEIGITFSFITFISSITSIWAFIVLVFSIKKLSKSSLIKSLLNVILAYLFLFAVLILFYSIYYLLIHNL